MKEKEIYIETENLAIPEVHYKKEEEKKEEKLDGKHVYEINVDVAVPEVNVKVKK